MVYRALKVSSLEILGIHCFTGRHGTFPIDLLYLCPLFVEFFLFFYFTMKRLHCKAYNVIKFVNIKNPVLGPFGRRFWQKFPIVLG